MISMNNSDLASLDNTFHPPNRKYLYQIDVIN